MQHASRDPDLMEAAAIFLRGSAGTADSAATSREIADKVVARVSQSLLSCSPASIRDIKRALAHFRREPSPWAREAVIEAVTGAAAHLPTTRRSN